VLGEVYTSEDWFCQAHHKEQCVWNLAPAAAQAALEQLAKVLHKCPQYNHIVLMPRLMTVYWRKMLNKMCDLIFENHAPKSGVEAMSPWTGMNF
jgi:hypothetical protein